MNNELKKKTLSGVFFKSVERMSVQLVSLIVSIILARLLLPSDYGTIVMANVLLEVLTVFVNYGLGTAIVHNKDATQKDISTCFWASLLLAAFLYAIVFLCAPLLAAYFETDALVLLTRIMGVQIFFLTISSVQSALIAKRFMYKQLLVITLIANIISGAVGIAFAYRGYGVWSLAIQSLISTGLTTLLSSIPLRWKPSFTFSIKSLKSQISYSWKLLLVGFADCLYAEARNIIITKKYSSESLAFYNKGAQFPKLISNTINQSIISVLFPSMSLIQDDNKKILEFVKRALSFLTFVLFPVLIGLLSVSDKLVLLLLTEKWLPCVPYMQILCLAYLITPLQSVYKQALKAIDQVKTLSIINIFEKVIGLALLAAAIPFGIEAICWSFVLYHIIGLFLYMGSGCRFYSYTFLSQIKDLLPNILCTMIMVLSVFLVRLVPVSHALSLMIQVLVGALAYITTAFIIKNPNTLAIIALLQRLKTKE